jgi:hypothetical protein
VTSAAAAPRWRHPFVRPAPASPPPPKRAPARKRPPARSLAAARACGGLPGFDPAIGAELIAGRLTITGFRAVTIDPHRDGRINWSMNPFGDPTWFEDFRSGGWIEQLISGYETNGRHAAAYRARAAAIIRGWLRAVPLSARDPLALVCLSQAFPGQRWTDGQVARAVNYDAAHWLGAWNQGLKQDIGLLKIGCGYPAAAFGGAALHWRRTAVRQLIASFEPNPLGPELDASGVPNEQSTLYADHVYNLWRGGLRVLAACGYRLPGWITTRIAKLPAFLAHATEPSGQLAQLGDSYVERSAAQGPRGGLVAVYQAGYVFGRSIWGKNASFYSLRFGPGRRLHGHDDHMGLTYYARGRNLIVDSGNSGYADTGYRAFLRSPEASSDLVMPGVPFQENVPTVLVKDQVRRRGQFYEFFDTAFDGDPRTRSVYVDQDPDLVLVYDRAAGTRSYQQLWHLDPALRVTSVSRSEAVATARGTELVLRQIPLPGRPVQPASTRFVRASVTPYQGWVSLQLRQRVADDVVTMSRTGPAVGMLTLIVPAAPGTPVATALKGPRYGPYRLSVRIGRACAAFVISADGAITGAGTGRLALLAVIPG